MFKAGTIMITIISIIIVCFIFGCSSDNKKNKTRVIATINDFQLTENEFQKKLVKDMKYTNTYKTTIEAKKKFLQTIIKKELLIQEAKRLGIDKEKEFISAIERYWEATLIKNLLEKKCKEIIKKACVSEKNIKKKYQELKSMNNSITPLDKIEKSIAKDLLEAKKTATLNKWTKSLYDKADITIDSGFLTE